VAREVIGGIELCGSRRLSASRSLSPFAPAARPPAERVLGGRRGVTRCWVFGGVGQPVKSNAAAINKAVFQGCNTRAFCLARVPTQELTANFSSRECRLGRSAAVCASAHQPQRVRQAGVRKFRTGQTFSPAAADVLTHTQPRSVKEKISV
jgi:hypothetical protein